MKKIHVFFTNTIFSQHHIDTHWLRHGDVYTFSKLPINSKGHKFWQPTGLCFVEDVFATSKNSETFQSTMFHSKFVFEPSRLLIQLLYGTKTTVYSCGFITIDVVSFPKGKCIRYTSSTARYAFETFHSIFTIFYQKLCSNFPGFSSMFQFCRLSFYNEVHRPESVVPNFWVESLQ